LPISARDAILIKGGAAMLKRHQVLLTEWQTEYVKNVAERFDQSFSEALRIFLSGSCLWIIPLLHPEFTRAIKEKELVEMIHRSNNPKTPKETRNKYKSKLHYEARKAVEYRLAKVKTKKLRT
jgi:hypothetical protein